MQKAGLPRQGRGTPRQTGESWLESGRSSVFTEAWDMAAPDGLILGCQLCINVSKGHSHRSRGPLHHHHLHCIIPPAPHTDSCSPSRPLSPGPWSSRKEERLDASLKWGLLHEDWDLLPSGRCLSGESEADPLAPGICLSISFFLWPRPDKEQGLRPGPEEPA